MTSAEGNSFKIADAYLLVGANLDEKAVQAAIRKAQAAVNRTRLDLSVGLDKRTLNAAVSVVRGQMRALNKELNVKFGVGLKEKDLADTAEEIRAAAEVMGHDAKIRMDVGLNSTSVAKTAADLRASARIMAADNKLNLKVDDDALSTADNEVQRFSNHWTRLAMLVGAGIFVGAGPLSALGLGAGAAGFTALAVAAEASDVRVKTAFKDMATAAKQSAQQAFTPIIPELQSIAEQGTEAVNSLENQFSRAAMELGPEMQNIAGGLIQAVEEGVDRAEPQLQKLDDLSKSVGNSALTLERGVSGFVNNIDPSRAVAGWNSLTGAVGRILPPFAQVLNTIEPLSDRLVDGLGSSVETLEREFSELNPVMQAAGSVVGALTPVLNIVGAPMLILATGAKLLTGSFANWSGAAARVKGAMSDLPGTLENIGQKLGFTTAAALAEAKAQAQLALDEARLAKEIDAEAVSEARATAAKTGSAESTLALIAAQKQLQASTEATATAQAELNAAEAKGQFALGPLGLALGVIGAGLALFAGRSKDAAPPVQDLTSDLERLANAAPGAAQGVLSNDPALQKLINNAKAAGINVQDMLAAIAGGPGQLKTFASTVQNTADALGGQTITLKEATGGMTPFGNATRNVTFSIKDLSQRYKEFGFVQKQLTPQQRQQIAAYEQLQGVLGQLNTTQSNQRNQQSAVNAVTKTSTAQQQLWNNYVAQAQNYTTNFGGSLNSTALQMANFAAQQKNGVFSAEDFVKAQISAAGAIQQIDQTHAQLAQAVTESIRQQAVAAKQVDAAHNQISQSANQVVNAEHAARESVLQVVDAEHAEEQAARAVGDARKQVVDAVRAEKQANAEYIADLRNIRVAQVNLTTARKEAVLELKAEQRQVLDQGDSVGEAQINLFNAQQAVIKAGLQNSKLKLSDLEAGKGLNDQNLQAYQILLQLAEAQHQLNDAKAQQSQLDAQNAADQKAGVAGNQGVLSAQQAIIAAQQQAAQQQEQLQQSKEAVAKASQGVKDAIFAEKQAHDAVAQAQFAERQAQLAIVQASQSEDQAKMALTDAILQQTVARGRHKSAVQANSTTLDINTVAGNRNATELLNLYDSQIAAGKSTDQARAAVEKEADKLGITRGAVDKLLNSIKNVQGKNATFGIVGQPSVNLSELINAAIHQGLNPRSLGFTSSEIGNARASGSGLFPTHREGGPIGGIGTGTSDSNLILASKGEHMLTAKEVEAAGGHGAIYALRRSLLKRAAGGPIGDGAATINANIMLAEMAGFFATTREAMNLVGMHTNNLPTLPKKNPPEIFPSFGSAGFNAAGDLGSHSALAAAAQRYAAGQLARYGWGPAQMSPLVKLWNQESGWNPYAINPTSGAYGIPQSLGHGHPYNLGDYVAQINWGLNYIAGRYGSPGAAWQHEVGFNWYDTGGFLPPHSMTLAANGTSGFERVRTADQEDRIVSAITALGSRLMGGVTINHIYKIDSIKTAHALAAQASANSTWDMMMVVR